VSFFSSVIHHKILNQTKKTELGRHEINIGFWGWNHIKSNHLKNQGDRRITLITEEQVPLLKSLSGQAYKHTAQET
jgi:hypothetical protein